MRSKRRSFIRVRLKSNGDYWQAFCKGHPTRSLGNKQNVTHREAEELCRRWEFELRMAAMAEVGSQDARASAPRLSTWLNRYAEQRGDLATGTKTVNRFTARYLQRHFRSDPPIDRIDRQQAAEWRAALAAGVLARDNELHNHAPTEQTVCKHVRAARRMFAEAVDQDLIRANPFDRLRGRPPAALKQWAYLDRDKMLAILAACPDDTWRAFFGLVRYAGLRAGEALRLRWTDVDFELNRITVNAPGTITTATNKKRPRVVPIEPAHCRSGLAAALCACLASAPDGAVRVCETMPKSQSRVNKRSAQIVAAAGVSRYAKVHHTLRKNAETDWANKYPQYVASEWAGHSIAVSEEHYLRVPDEFYAAPSLAS